MTHFATRRGKNPWTPLISREKIIGPPTVNLVPPVHISNELSLSLIYQLLVTPTRTCFCNIKDQGGEGAKDTDVIIFLRLNP